MALYDNRHWLLSHIRNSFISGDDTGMSEIIMTGQNLCRTLSDQNRFPGIEETDDDEDHSAHSLDNCSDLEFGARRQRSNTAIRLERMDREKKEAASITRIKWQNPKPFTSISEEDKLDMFGLRPAPGKSSQENVSLLTQQLQKANFHSQNPFREYAKFDGNAQVGIPVRKYGIFLTMLRPEHSNYPMYVCVISSAKVFELIGFILWKCSSEYPEYPLKGDVSYYGLHIAEDDGEVDWVFPCLNPKEVVSKFVFKLLALVERSSVDEVDSELKTVDSSFYDLSTLRDENISTSKIFDSRRIVGLREILNNRRGITKLIMRKSPPLRKFILENGVKFSFAKDNDNNDIACHDTMNNEESNPLYDQMSAIDAVLHKSYKVQLLHKIRSKVEVNLGISGEKIDIDPVLRQNTITFFSKLKPASYDIDFIVACDLTETKSSNRAVLRLVYDRASAQENALNSANPELLSWNDFKHHDFEAEQPTAEEIVQKINHILDLRCSIRRKEYLAMRESKSHRRRSFHIGPR